MNKTARLLPAALLGLLASTADGQASNDHHTDPDAPIASPARTGPTMEILGTTIRLPLPDDYIDARAKMQIDPNMALFFTEAVEPWEGAGEISESIMFYGIGLKPTSEDIKQQKFEEIVGRFVARIEAQIADEPDSEIINSPDHLVPPDIIQRIYRGSHGKSAAVLAITDDRSDRKAVLIHSGYTLPGIVTYPLFEEISFVRVADRIVIFHAIRVNTSMLTEAEQERLGTGDARAQLLATGRSLRDELVTLNR